MKPFRFCPACGTAIGEPQAEVGSTCPSCGRTWYRNSAPTVGAVIVRDGKALISRRASDPEKGRFDIPGGFLEAGEDPIEGLHREIEEELGIRIAVSHDDYLGATVHEYGDEGDYVVAITYRARVASGEPVANDDVAEIRWVGIEEIDGFDWAWPHNRDDTRRALQRETQG